jgi:uncharacterized protein (TIRG00374 family)
MRRYYSYAVKLSIASLLIGYLVYSVNLQNLLMTLSQLNPLVGVCALISSLSFFLLGAINIWLLLKTIHRIPFNVFLYSYTYSYMINLFAPGQLGDASLAIFLKKQNITYAQSAVVYMLDKCITAVVLFFVGFIGSRFIFPRIFDPIWLLILPVIGIILFILAISCVWLIKFEHKMITRLRAFLINSFMELKTFNNSLSILLLNISITIMKWAIMTLTFYLGFYSFGIKVTWPAIGIIPVLASLVGYIPISIGGIGTVEFCAIYLFSLISVDSAYVLSTYLFLRMLTYLQPGLVFVIYMIKPMTASSSQ